jgi:hypothetical protein
MLNIYIIKNDRAFNLIVGFDSNLIRRLYRSHSIRSRWLAITIKVEKAFKLDYEFIVF